MYYLHKATSAVSCVKSNACQWEETLRDDFGFPTVYRRIYRRKFLALSNPTSGYIRKCIRIGICYVKSFKQYLNIRLLNMTNLITSRELDTVKVQWLKHRWLLLNG